MASTTDNEIQWYVCFPQILLILYDKILAVLLNLTPSIHPSIHRTHQISFGVTELLEPTQLLWGEGGAHLEQVACLLQSHTLVCIPRGNFETPIKL